MAKKRASEPESGHHIVLANENKYTEADIDDIDVDEDGPPEHLWSDIAPSTGEQIIFPA